ncbi:tetratricopeptide repeat protein [Sandaracinus amylolyticus]|uniref:Uncharacterized protein n=1 Tax=Sandaracinus amylolyticus TaxID=927083 RepID=A0A0F6W649_9BACT|nr:hypothetical protein [Sandaracinus amylolyticus]AKF08258.1 hypothetical protein DB32_005407 [Sandaracinus amylolyticus]
MRGISMGLVLLGVVGCGGAQVRTTSASGGAIEPAALFVEASNGRTDLLQAPEASMDELEAARRSARGAERRRVLRDLARAHLLAAESSEGREARRHRSDAERAADAAVNGSRDSTLLAEMAFVSLWLSWRAGERAAVGRAERFTTRFAGAGELALMAWMIRGELAFAAERWADAATAYRYALGQLEHPLYAYALHRSAESWDHEGRADDARAARTEVVQLGCASDASDATMRVVQIAARELGVAMVADESGRVRPSTCATTTTRSASGGDDELPPAMR